MTTDTQLAFDTLEAQAIAAALAEPRDRISLRDHLVEVEIGAFQVERGMTQRVSFSVVVEIRPHPAPLHDDVDRILSYDRITEAIATELAAERLNLLETLAERVAERILMEPQAMRVFVRIEKLDRGPGALGVEIVRSRAAIPKQIRADEVFTISAQPLVAYVSNAMIAAEDLPDRLEALLAHGAPVVLCVGLPDDAIAPVAVAAVQHRIDLLAIEMNAWRLAARDARCVVLQSRTEIDWALKQGQLIVWAPSKLVLDTANGPLTHSGDGVELAAWLAEVLEADLLVLPVGVVPPAVSRVTIETCAP
jgi:dihydroneopterin aldolase